MPKRLLRLPAVILVLATSGCFLFGTHPTTWEGRYQKALDELEAAQTDIGRFYAINDAAKAAFEVGKIEKAQAHAQEALDLASRFHDDWNYGNAIHDGHMVLGWERRSETRPVRRSESDPPAGRLFYAD